MEWIHFPRIRTFVEKLFHGLFSRKKRRNLGVFLRLNRFQEENTVLTVISLPIGQPTDLDPYKDITGWLNFSRITAREICFRAGISLQKNLSRKICRFFVSKISPATGVKRVSSLWCGLNYIIFDSTGKDSGFWMSFVHFTRLLGLPWHYLQELWDLTVLNLSLTPVAGLIFETKNREIFLERFFWKEITAREQVSRVVILEKFYIIQKNLSTFCLENQSCDRR